MTILSTIDIDIAIISKTDIEIETEIDQKNRKKSKTDIDKINRHRPTSIYILLSIDCSQIVTKSHEMPHKQTAAADFKISLIQYGCFGRGLQRLGGE
jgi:hypothetical protein